MPRTSRNTALKEILEKYLRGNASVEEIAFVEEYYAYFDKEAYDPEILLPDEQRIQGEKIFSQLLERRKMEAVPSVQLKSGDVPAISYSPVAGRRVGFSGRGWLRYAAAFLLIAGTACFLYLNNRTSQQEKAIAQKQSSEAPAIEPGGNRAVLTLADGSTIILDSAATGSLALQGNTQILKLDGGKLAYNADHSTGEILYNTINTPRGGQYQIVLHDGTKVWLNAASSIRFPTVFTTKREVSVTGEAYFEVSPDKSRPFQVDVGDMAIEVLGTSFNVNAYGDEDGVRATLLEGKVNIRTPEDLKMLMPGQQSIYRSNNRQIAIETPNLEQVIAWKNGFFYFKNADLKAVMRQLGRWYNVDIVYGGEMPARIFKGGIGRDLQLSDVLEILKETGINIELKENKLYVMP